LLTINSIAKENFMAYPHSRKTHKNFQDKPTKPKDNDPDNLFDSINEEESEEVDLGSENDIEHDEEQTSNRGTRPSKGLYNWGDEE